MNNKKTDNECKKKYGQFYTTNYNYILDCINIPKNIKYIIEPFVGKGDLINYINSEISNSEISNYEIEYYDIDPKITGTIKRDTIKNPPNYNNKFVITNPPYLARNKSNDKELYDMYNTNDLYKCFLFELIKQEPSGGIIIIPLNFWCSIRENDIKLRKKFIDKFNIIRVNVFEEKVFNDTSYTICSILFTINSIKQKDNIKFVIYPSKKEYNFLINETNNYTIGGEIYKLPNNNKYKIGRLIKGMKPNTNILLKCIDNNIKNKISLSIVKDTDIYYDKTKNKSERSYATITIEPNITLHEQKKLVINFNNFLEKERDKYNSLFLNNYRESNSIARKRISFELVYTIISHLLENYQ
jgi:hypothetical protein